MQSQTDSSSTEDGGKPNVRNRFKRLAILGLAGATALFSVNEMYYAQYSQKNKYLKAECDNYNGENMTGPKQVVFNSNPKTIGDLIGNLKVIENTSSNKEEVKLAREQGQFLQDIKEQSLSIPSNASFRFPTPWESYADASKRFNLISKAANKIIQKQQSQILSLEGEVKNSVFAITFWSQPGEEPVAKVSISKMAGERLNLEEMAEKMKTNETNDQSQGIALQGIAIALYNNVPFGLSGFQHYNTSDEAKLNFSVLANRYFGQAVSKKNPEGEIIEIRTDSGPVYAAMVGSDILVSPIKEDILNQYFTTSGFLKNVSIDGILQATGKVQVKLDTKNILIGRNVGLLLEKNGVTGNIEFGEEAGTELIVVEFDVTTKDKRGIADEAKKRAKDQTDMSIHMFNLAQSIAKISPSEKNNALKAGLRNNLKNLVTDFDQMIQETYNRADTEKLFNALVSRQRDILFEEKTLKHLKEKTLKQLGLLVKERAADVGALDPKEKDGIDEVKKLINSFKLVYFGKDTKGKEITEKAREKAREEFNTLYTKIEERKGKEEYKLYMKGVIDKKESLVADDKELKKAGIKSSQLSEFKAALEEGGKQVSKAIKLGELKDIKTAKEFISLVFEKENFVALYEERRHPILIQSKHVKRIDDKKIRKLLLKDENDLRNISFILPLDAIKSKYSLKDKPGEPKPHVLKVDIVSTLDEVTKERECDISVDWAGE